MFDPATRTSFGRRAKDWLARLLVSCGGLLIILCILLILVFLLKEVVPLWRGATSEVVTRTQAPQDPKVVAVDASRTLAFVLQGDGRAVALRAGDGAIMSEVRLQDTNAGGSLIVFASTPEGTMLAAGTTDGRVLVARCRTSSTFAAGVTTVVPELLVLPELIVDPAKRPIEALAVQETEKGAVVAALVAGTEITVVAQIVTTNPISEERELTELRRKATAPFPVQALAVDHEAKELYAGCKDGRICWWRYTSEQPTPQVHQAANVAITGLCLLLGDRTLVVGTASGQLAAWMAVRQGEGNAFVLRKVRELPSLEKGVVALARSLRNKSFLALDAGGSVAAYYGTTGERRSLLANVVSEPRALAYAQKGDGALVVGGAELLGIAIADPHPEATLKAMFTSIWYEGSAQPSLTWQSTGGTDDFELKLSLVPLIVGTLKGTLFSLLLAVPLAVLGAMYVAHFMHPDLKRTIKPVIEIMAALPSVVLGFLAAMWLAPRLEQSFCALILAPVVLPGLVLLAGALGSRLPGTFRARFQPGTEALGFAAVLVLGGALCLQLAPGFEDLAFGGDFPGFVQRHLGVVYEQRNAVVIGLAMAFAVIPIVFSIAEEAFANVPKGLVSGSLALGATRWQTVTRVVLPTASPGIFSAIMVGFGRAVGETMIVLMATGNTAILDMSPFNGFRTLSANIAVEIPEAPQGGTLYRVLFFAGLLLFAFTFVANTIAELVRQRLRVRYAGL